MTLGNSVFGIFKTIFDILLKIKKFAFLEYHKLSVQNLEILNKNKENSSTGTTKFKTNWQFDCF